MQKKSLDGNNVNSSYVDQKFSSEFDELSDNFSKQLKQTKESFDKQLRSLKQEHTTALTTLASIDDVQQSKKDLRTTFESDKKAHNVDL